MNEQTKKPTGLPERFFIDFLKQNSCYNEFCWNLSMHGSKNKRTWNDYLEFANKLDRLPIFISGAFLWALTVEGGKYWQEINDAWIIYLTSAIKLES